MRTAFAFGVAVAAVAVWGCAEPTARPPGPPAEISLESGPPDSSEQLDPSPRSDPDAQPFAEPLEAATEVPPDPVFGGAATVSVGELIEALEDVAVEMESVPAVKADYDAFIEAHGLQDRPDLFTDYVRVKLAFESTRDGGFWGLRWRITNRKPNSEEIWSQWRNPEEPSAVSLPTAEAECDELSALFAFVVRRLGVDHVGLFWPEWNHVVAVWTVHQDDRQTRIVVPTSQIFLSASESLGTAGFDPTKQKTIFTYKRKDVKTSAELPGALAEHFVAQARTFSSRPQVELQAMRNEQARALGGS